MAAKSLKYFMRDNTEEVVTVPGLESFKDENGKVVDFEIKVLSNEHIRKIQNNYRKRSIATDPKGNPYIVNGEVAWKVEKDNDRSLRHIMVEAFVYPDLKDKELMAHYGCVDVTEMPMHVFSNTKDFNDAAQLVMKTLGMIESTTPDQEIEEAKN